MHLPLFPLLLLGCPPGGKDSSNSDVTDADVDADTDTDADADADADADTDADYFVPAALGFHINSGWDTRSGALVHYSLDGVAFAVPIAVLTFASLDYFYTTDLAERDAYDCTVSCPLTVEATNLATLDYPTGASLPSWTAWAGSIEVRHAYFERDDAEGNCSNFDPDDYPGGDPTEVFDGMHFGVAFGPLSDFLVDGWDKTELEELGPSAFTMFIAVNHPDETGGHTLEGFNWTTGLLFEMDTSGVVTVKDEAFVSEMDVESGGFVMGRPYWFEDVPNLDFGILKDGGAEAAKRP